MSTVTQTMYQNEGVKTVHWSSKALSGAPEWESRLGHSLEEGAHCGAARRDLRARGRVTGIPTANAGPLDPPPLRVQRDRAIHNSLNQKHGSGCR